jgi:hypothetical protein
MWHINEAVEVARAIHKVAFESGWNVHLGGGLLTKSDTSEHDADLLFMPRYQVGFHQKKAVIAHLEKDGWIASPLLNDLDGNRVHTTLTKDGKVLELIFFQLPGD